MPPPPSQQQPQFSVQPQRLDEFVAETAALVRPATATATGGSGGGGGEGPVQQVRQPQAMSRFNWLCQKYALASEFEIDEVGLQAFRGRLRVGGRELADDGPPHSSKKAAKEAIAAQGVELVEQLIQRGQLGQLGAAASAVAEAPALNWIGKLIGEQGCFLRETSFVFLRPPFSLFLLSIFLFFPLHLE
jgi:hypothetical protein